MKLCAAALVLISAFSAYAQKGAVSATLPEPARWSAHAKAITVTRDNWGIPHIHGKTDADAVFGMIYTQCEDDFNRVETNYLVSLGRLAEAEGEAKIWQDLRQQLFIDPAQLKKDYADSPPWLQALMQAWADGANFYLSKHPETKPRVLTHFEPWMALSFTEGSIGGDVERVNLAELEKFYGAKAAAQKRVDENNAVVAQLAQVDRDVEPGGSNGAAIAPSNTANHHALLLINPHTSFFFRSELQMQSDEGLNAYGAVTWGQIFVYQGFNDRAGWMHTSSNVDAIDEFRNTLVRPGGPVIGYKYGKEVRPFKTRTITLKYKGADGAMKMRSFDAKFDHRGPIVRSDGDAWVSIELMNTPVPALEQSFLRTKARSYADYKKTMELMANSSNNTIFASADGDIAYWHGNYIPERDTRYDFTKPVDGSNPATDWQGLMPLAQIPQLKNPHSGWLSNVNNAPWWGAGESSLKKADFPPYVEQGGETSRGVHMTRVMNDRKNFTLDTFLAAAFDPYQPWFARTLPVLLKAYDALPADDPQRKALAEQIAVLRPWQYTWAADSVAESLAVYWGEAAGTPVTRQARAAGVLWEDYVATKVDGATMLTALQAASDKLTADFGTWKTPWGEINRYQRNDAAITQHFDDAKPSTPVPFAGATWGSLASFAARAYPGTKKRYGTSGNSFVAVVEFGPERVHARAITCGGDSGNPDSPHFGDEVARYASGDLREVMYYPDQLKGHVERTYHPGE
jgi:acyl-homoserine lactone acylase PvdQ